MASITTTTFSSAIKTKWEEKTLSIAEGKLVAAKFASIQPMKKGEGGTLVFNRILRPSLVTAASTAGIAGMVTSSSAKALYTNKIEVTPSLFQDVFALDDNAETQTFITNSAIQDAIANQMAISLDYQVMKMLATQGMRHRIDKDASYQVSGTCDSGSSTTQVVDSDLTTTNLAGGYVGITNPDGPNYDHPWKQVASVSANTLVTAAWPTAMTTSSKYRVVSTDGIAATDKLTTTGLFDVQGLHDKLETELFPGALLRGFIDAAQHRDLLDDTIWVAAAEYDNSSQLKGYRVARWAGVEFMISSNIYREDVTGTEYGHGGAGTTGVAYVSPIFGANSYALTPWGNGSGKFAVQWVYTDKPDTQNLLLNATFIGWKTYWGGTVTRSTSVVNLITGATSQAVEV